ncbi:MAG TPA: FAD-dependent oxidoreductase [Acidimicrobiales bacterium]
MLVVGGGLAGLVAAATAAECGATVTLLEGHGLGGRARSEPRRGFTFNRGAHALYPGGPASRVLEALGAPTRSGGIAPLKGTYVLRGGRLHLLPRGATTMARTSLLRLAEKPRFARAFLRLTATSPEQYIGRSVTDVVTGLGLTGAAADMALATVRVSTYANAPDQMDAGAAIANVQAGLKGVRYLDGGWQTLVDAVAATATARGVRIVADGAVQSVTATPGGVLVTTTGGTHEAGSVILAAGPPDSAAACLGDRPASWDRLGPPVTAACLDLGVRRMPDPRFVLGLDEPLYLSTHCPPAGLAPPGQFVVSLLRYQPVDDDMPALDQRARLRALAAQAGITDDDIVEDRFLARITVAGGFPTAAAGGLAGRPPVEVEGQAGIFVAGDWVGPEGLLADAAVASGAEAGRLAAARTATIGVG